MGQKIDMKNVVMTVVDNGSETFTLVFDDGDFSWTEANAREYILDRGSLDTVRNGDEAPMDISFDGRLDYWQGDDGDLTLADVLNKRGEAAAWESTSADISGQECAPYCVDLVLTHTPDCSTGITNPDEVITFPQFRVESLQFSVRNGKISCSGKSNATAPTSVRSA